MTAHARTGSATRSLRGLRIGAWMAVAAERRRLRELTDRDLRDMGIDPAEARREAARPFWDLPGGR